MLDEIDESTEQEEGITDKIYRYLISNISD